MDPNAELAAMMDSLSPPADAETTINKSHKPDRTSVTLWPTTHTEIIVEEGVETMTEWVDFPIHTPSESDIFPRGVKPAFRPRLVNVPVENGAGRMVAKERMSYVTLLGVLLLVLGLVCVVNLLVVKVYRKHSGSETVKIASGKDKDGRLVRGRENRKRERRWRYDMSGFMKRPAGAAEAKGRVEDNEKDWEDVED